MAESRVAARPRERIARAPVLAGQRLWSRLFHNPRVMVGAAVIGSLYMIALLATVVAPYDPNHQVLSDRLLPPTPSHWLGTDTLGRDILSRAIWAARVSLTISLLATVITLGIGCLLGLVAGFSGGWLDNALMRVTDVFLAFPILILLITVIAIYGSNVVLFVLFLGLAAWPTTARLVRAETLSLKARDFVVAARVVGCDSTRIVLAHILPNVVPVLVVAATLRVATVVLVEASLSYFGLGVPPPTATWGNMVADGRLLLETAWWITASPGALVVVTVLAYNLLGDGLRDALDPRRDVPRE